MNVWQEIRREKLLINISGTGEKKGLFNKKDRSGEGLG